jgi:hypothetical protein
MSARQPSARTSSAQAALSLGRTTSGLARDVADVLQFPPARAAAALLVLIFETVEGMRRNKEQCARLAERAAHVLLGVHEQMRGRWTDAPESLVRNLANYEA